MADRPRTPRPDRSGGSFGDRPRGQRPDNRDRRRGSPDWKPRRSPGGAPPPFRPEGGAGPRRDGDRPQRDFSDRPRPNYGDRPRPNYGDRPRPSYGDRPRPSYGDRPRRDFNDRPPRDDAARPQRNFEDRPRRDFNDRPQRNFEDRPRRDFNDRPRREFGDRPQRDFSDRPQRDFSDSADRPRRYQGPGPKPERHFSDRPQRGFGRPVRSFDSRRPRVEAASASDALLGEGEELIAGKRPVEEAFAARREAIRLLIVPERRAALDALAIHATTLRIPVVELEGGSLTSLAGFDGHQGVALVVKPRAHATVDDILARAKSRDAAPFVLVLDSLEDPQNFGTLLRSAEACGVDGVIYPTHRAAPLSAAAIKASAGASEHLLLAPVDDLAGTLADLHADGLRIVGADEDASLSYAEADLRGPLAMVVGSEGKGMSGPVKRRLDLAIRIPMQGKIGSLNAAVAGSVMLFAAAQQRPIRAAATRSAEPTQATETPDSPDSSEAAAKPKRKAPAKKSEPKAKTAKAVKPAKRAKSETKAAKPAAKPKRTTIRQLSPEEAEQLLP